ncbi:MAG TPA: glycerol-3-phosphate dehydrogenase [Steroidobacteraceae bacterium]|nr:glycerol-3-phosphate dehydrogenase [Steroidobacteraceae bacterium]
MSGGARQYDLLVVGGGINGVGVARDAAGRGLGTLLCEQHDLGAHTSSASTKLIHGGLRYLEFYDFRLVRKSLREREIVLRSAPHLVRPMRFVLPHDEHLRPAWMIRAGLYLYDHLARRRLLPASRAVDLRRHPAGAALDPRYTQGFVYSDAAVDDARLVVLAALDARERGATVLSRTRCVRLERSGDRWTATLAHADGAESRISAAAVVNATGPWVDRFLDEATPVPARRHPRLVKGSHIVVPRLFEHDHAYIFQGPDRRIVFAIPYEGDCTLVGTTERDYTGDLATPSIEPAEVTYLLSMSNRYFRRMVGHADVKWTFAGLRPLLADPSDVATSVTRDYVLDVDQQGPPLLSIYGGKLTTYRKLAEDVLDGLASRMGWSRRHWTAGAPLPGGDIARADYAAFRRSVRAEYPWLPDGLLDRMAAAYGTRVRRMLGDARGISALGEEVLPGLHAREIDYLRREEWALTAEDILYRRSKLALHLPADAAERLEEWLVRNPVARPADYAAG